MKKLDYALNKIQTADEAFMRIRELKEKGNCKIVFTNGCFDLLHRGHIDYLSRAADMGTHLIVGLNTDSSVRKLKGSTRPICNQESRSIVMAALEAVSMVILFDEDTPYELITKIKPDILVKGGDYTIDNIVGAAFVQENGGMVKTIPFVPGYSTSAIEKRIVNANTSHL
jgi:rfaE bifunctional protein nucleotidyltransferase chain/domain